MPTAATMTAKELADVLGVSTWAVYQSVTDGDCPVPPIRVGRRIVFAKAAVDRLLGVGQNSAADVGEDTDGTPDVAVLSVMRRSEA
jgi:excisionase family DNA binding protein